MVDNLIYLRSWGEAERPPGWVGRLCIVQARLPRRYFQSTDESKG